MNAAEEVRHLQSVGESRGLQKSEVRIAQPLGSPSSGMFIFELDENDVAPAVDLVRGNDG